MPESLLESGNSLDPDADEGEYEKKEADEETEIKEGINYYERRESIERTEIKEENNEEE